MNVFILSSGRVASTALTAACKHISNYSCAHESRVGIFGAEKLNYPNDHIEVDNRLVWFSHQLDANYGDKAYYIHLKRNRLVVAKSFCERWNLKESIVKAYGHGVLMMPNIKKEQRLQVCLDFVDFSDKNISCFISDKPNSMVIRTEKLKEDFSSFWSFINAEGDYDKAIDTFDTRFNRNNTSWLRKLKNAVSF